jgi:catechol 2,3-dioxygenase-like lactoylglutathione lyase family enzyme
VKIQFVAGFGPIVRDMDASFRFYREGLGVPIEPGDYPATEDLAGVKAFALWALSAAAESCFAKKEWPADVPVPQAWLEFDVESVDAVGSAAAELEQNGYRMLVRPRLEPWGQTVARVLSPEGLLVGVTYTPWMHE